MTDPHLLLLQAEPQIVERLPHYLPRPLRLLDAPAEDHEVVGKTHPPEVVPQDLLVELVEVQAAAVVAAQQETR